MSHLNNHAYYYGIIKEYFDSLVNDPRTDFKSLNSLVAKIQEALRNLKMSYAGQQVTVNYSDPMTRLAYLYYYVPAYAMMTDLSGATTRPQFAQRQQRHYFLTNLTKSAFLEPAQSKL